MLKKLAVLGLALGCLAWSLSGCGGSTTPTPKVPTGTLITFIADSPTCDVLAFRPNVTQIFLSPQGGGPDVNALVGTAAFAPQVKVNLAGLRDASTVLNIASIPAGTYVAISLKFSLPSLVLFDPTQSPPLRTVTVTLNPTTPKVPLQSPLVLNAPVNAVQQVAAVLVDFNLLQSIGPVSLDKATNTATATVVPALTATPLTGSTKLTDFEGIRGFVERVDTVSANTKFIGDFQMQLLEGGSGSPSIVVNLTGNQALVGAPDLPHLLTGSYVEVDGYLDTSGNFIANPVNSVNVQDQESADQNKLAFIGNVLSVNRDSSGNLTSFNFSVHEEQPNPGAAAVGLDTILVGNVSSSTVYQFDSPSTNFASLPFGPSSIVKGQELIVHGTYTPPPAVIPPATAPPTTVAAEKIYLALQTAQGNFASLVQQGSDDRTGAFQLVTCATLLQGVPILVVTNNQTSFVNVAGLAELAALTPPPTLLVKGLPFFEPAGTKINGMVLPVGTLVILAKQVHQLT